MQKNLKILLLKINMPFLDFDEITAGIYCEIS